MPWPQLSLNGAPIGALPYAMSSQKDWVSCLFRMRNTTSSSPRRAGSSPPSGFFASCYPKLRLQKRLQIWAFTSLKRHEIPPLVAHWTKTHFRPNLGQAVNRISGSAPFLWVGSSSGPAGRWSAAALPPRQSVPMAVVREPNAEPIPGYRLLEPLGSGGFGEVWKCEAPGGLFKAIKFVYGNLKSLDMDGVHAEQEWQALNRIKEVRHPFVLSLDRIQDVDGELVIVMELADKSLYDSYVECQSAGLLGIPRDALLRYVRDAAEALDHMNEKHNLQHLDIKPRNLFLISDRVKVADFGLVKHLERQSASGLLGGVTPLYAPPETFSGQISEASDQYSLAIVYQELLTGQRPYAGKTVRQLAQQHLTEDPDLRALPEAERPIVGRCLAKDPAKRFPNCMAFIYSLYKARSAAPVHAA